MTRKLFTMLLSVIVYNHKLTKGQWLGAGVVFAGISVEAIVKRKGTSSLLQLLHLIMTNRISQRCSRKTHHPREGKGENKIIVNIRAHLCVYSSNMGFDVWGAQVLWMGKETN